MLVSIYVWSLLQVITGTDVIMRNGVTQNVATKLHAITEMSCYSGAERSFDVSQFDLARAARAGEIVVI